MWQRLLDFLFPRLSLTGREGMHVTPEEERHLRSWPVVIEAAELRSRGVKSLDRIVAASTYESSPLLRLAIHRFKYRRVPALQRELGALLAAASALLTVTGDSVLCPVPLHWTRKFQRGFNQSALLAAIVAEECGWHLAHLLTRVRPTGHQARRSRAARLVAMKHAFACVMDNVPSHVVLVDDIATTGATLDACAKALKERGVKRVDALVVAVG
ncbi:MAG TPA: phosphoribosyltransferase family protein [Candidatus Peribacteraceae bacterium]|nr:phosphoribosyltransferase family protein [Candidatus Peribacteraceae bacterium]